MRVTGGHLEPTRAIGAPEGTAVEVADLFVTRGSSLVRADGFPPHEERFAWAGIDLRALLAHEGGV